jgi:hypothetical protein
LVFRIEVNHVKSGFFFASKRNEIFANFASEAKVRAHPTPCSIVISEATMAHIGYARSRCLPKNFNVKKSSMPLMLPGIVDSMKSVFFLLFNIVHSVAKESCFYFPL